MYEPGDMLLGKYRIEALVGQGAFAHVYRATHLALNAPRALKILRRDAPGVGSADYAEFQARFQLEARLGAALDHPHVIRVYDFELDGETLILVMEYAAGGSLSEQMAQARAAGGFIPVDEAVRIAQEAAAGLAALHERDIVHRDVKPSNLLFDDKGRVKVSDLGLAQIPHGPSERSLGGSLARPHSGTPGYMSPEQQLTTAYLPPASDVYSLGVTLFEMLTGRAYKNLKPGTRLSKACMNAPQWLDELLARMLADEPKARPWDGTELVAELEEGQRGEQQKAEAEERVRQDARRAQRADQERQRFEAEQLLVARTAEQARLRRDEVTREAEAKAAAQAKAEAAERARQAELKRRQEEAEAVARSAAKAAQQQPIWQRIGIELVKIPAGDFLYGEDKRKITLPEYRIARTPVTNAQYKAFVDATGYRPPSHWQGVRIPKGKENHPAAYVDWNDAGKFCEWAGLRLPTEQEWEKAARGTDGREYSWGSAWEPGRCNSVEAKIGDTTPVDRYPSGASPYGLLDMAGNVWEWCADYYDSDKNARVLRGGSFYDGDRIVRCAFRRYDVPGYQLIDLGFRVASAGL